MGNFLKGLASIAAPFVGGTLGTGLGVLSGLMGQNESQGKANSYNNQLQGIASILNSGYLQNAGALNQGLLQSSGIGSDRRTPAQKGMANQIAAIKMAQSSRGLTGGGAGVSLANQLKAQYGITDQDIAAYDAAQVPTYDPSFNPYQGILDKSYSQSAIDQSANSLFNPAQLTGQFANNEAASRNAYDGAIAQAQADAARRGVGLGSGAASLQNQMRASQASGNTAFRNSAYQDLFNQERNYRIGQAETGNALQAQGINQAHSNLVGTYGMLSNGVDRGIGILGGLGGMWQSRADQQGQGISGMLGSLAGTGTLADIFKRRPGGVGTAPYNPGGGIAGTPPIIPQTTGTAGTVNSAQSVLGSYAPIQKRFP